MGRPFCGGHVRTLGGRTKYRLVYRRGKQMLEHRAVMEEALGRRLLRTEIVHHKDGNGLNNDIKNLEVTSFAGHRKIHDGPWLWDLGVALRMRADGATVRAVADRFHVSEAAVNRGLKRRGYSTSTPRKLKFDRQTAFRLFSEGLSVGQIANQLKVTDPSVRRALQKAGLLKKR